MTGTIHASEVRHTAIPTYVLGKFIIAGEHARGEYDIPFAVTERPLIPSVNRGRKVTNMCGGIYTKITKDEMTRAPLFVTGSPAEAGRLERFIQDNTDELKAAADSTTRYGHVTSVETKVVDSDIYLRIGMDCGDAAGHNMTTKAASALADRLIERFPGAVDLVTLSSNYCTDKKPARVNLDKGRGKRVEAYATISEDILEQHLKTDGAKLEELNQKKNITGSRIAGSMARNAHHANIVAALYLATGQDIANVVEGSLGETYVERSGDNIVFGVRLPSLIVGTVGGGTLLPYAQENLLLMGCQGAGEPIGSNSKKLAEIIGAAVLAGELSLMAALTNNHELLKSHVRYER
ncbi:hydroxymethylglutaryl-CoA reductase [Nanoarchaeota archaeon]